MNKDGFLGAVLLLLGILAVAMTSHMPVRTFAGDPGPRLFPYFCGAALALCGGGILVNALRSRAKAEIGSIATWRPAEWGQIGIMFVMLVFFALGLWILGFYIAVPLATFVIYWLVSGPQKRSTARGVIYSVTTFAAVYLVFAKVLHSFMPPGMLF